MRASFAVILCALTVSILWMLACSSSSTTSTPPDANDAGSAENEASSDTGVVVADAGICPAISKYQWGSKRCDECAAFNCCDRAITCDSNKGCNGLLACNRNCVNEADAKACASVCEQDKDDASYKEWEAVNRCVYIDECYVHCTSSSK